MSSFLSLCRCVVVMLHERVNDYITLWGASNAKKYGHPRETVEDDRHVPDAVGGPGLYGGGLLEGNSMYKRPKRSSSLRNIRFSELSIHECELKLAKVFRQNTWFKI